MALVGTLISAFAVNLNMLIVGAMIKALAASTQLSVYYAMVCLHISTLRYRLNDDRESSFRPNTGTL
jgi:hypothetical protein